MTMPVRQAKPLRTRTPRIARGVLACALACTLGAALGLGGCATASENGAPKAATATATKSFTSMDTAMAVTVHASDQVAADDAAQACMERVRELDGLLDPGDAASEIARLNESGGEALAVSSDVRALVEAALDVAEKTDGAFDPTVYPVTSAWGFTSGEHRVPSLEELNALVGRVGYDNASVDEVAGTVTLAHSAQIDVGGVAKGFAADELRTLLAKRGVTSALLDLGGNVTSIGSKPSGEPWKIGIANPDAPDALAGAIELSDATVSTSGAYQRFFVDGDGITRHHLIDPATGYPAETDLVSASVIGPDGARCDALSTALYVMGLDRALELWRHAEGDEAFEAVLIAQDGSVHVTAGIADAFEAADAYAGKVVVER